MVVMASENEASCEEDPNFATIWAFFEKFGQLIGITDIGICELQSMLENTQEVSPVLIDLHIKLLRKIKKNVSPIEKWERFLIKFCHTFSNLDAWEIERFSYKNAKLSCKVRILKELLESQFDLNPKFKLEVNKLTSNELRAQPLGRDKFGHAYWFQSDDNYQIRVYKEDLDDEKWSLVAKDKNGLVSLIERLSDGDEKKTSSDPSANEDSNSLSEKPILDTGQQDTDSKKTSEDEDSNLEKDEDQTKSIDDVKSDLEEKSYSEEEPEEIKNEPDSLKAENLKRSRDEDEDTNSDSQKCKIIKMNVSAESLENKFKCEESKSPKPEIGEAIEEPLMKIEGEGSGIENECCLVGETIEEDILYFYGRGNGADCETGNHSDDSEESQEKLENSATETKKNLCENKALKEKEVVQKVALNDDKSAVLTIESNGTETDNEDDKKIYNEDIKTEKIEEKLEQKCVVENKSDNLENLPEEKQEQIKIENKDIKTEIIINEHKVKLNTKESEAKSPVIEPICVKTTLYICGEKNYLEETVEKAAISREEDIIVSTEDEEENLEDSSKTVSMPDNKSIETESAENLKIETEPEKVANADEEIENNMQHILPAIVPEFKKEDAVEPVIENVAPEEIINSGKEPTETVENINDTAEEIVLAENMEIEAAVEKRGTIIETDIITEKKIENIKEEISNEQETVEKIIPEEKKESVEGEKAVEKEVENVEEEIKCEEKIEVMEKDLKDKIESLEEETKKIQEKAEDIEEEISSEDDVDKMEIEESMEEDINCEKKLENMEEESSKEILEIIEEKLDLEKKVESIEEVSSKANVENIEEDINLENKLKNMKEESSKENMKGDINLEKKSENMEQESSKEVVESINIEEDTSKRKVEEIDREKKVENMEEESFKEKIDSMEEEINIEKKLENLKEESQESMEEDINLEKKSENMEEESSKEKIEERMEEQINPVETTEAEQNSEKHVEISAQEEIITKLKLEPTRNETADPSTGNVINIIENEMSPSKEIPIITEDDPVIKDNSPQILLSSEADNDDCRPKIKAVRRVGGITPENVLKIDQPEEISVQKINETIISDESSITNSPAQSVQENSTVELSSVESSDVQRTEKIPLAVEKPEKDTSSESDKKTTAEPTLVSFSMDFKDSNEETSVQNISQVNVRKRALDAVSPKTPESEDEPEKKIKLKGRRQIDTALRKSVEQRIEQLHGSSSDSKESEEESPKAKKIGRFKKKTPNKKEAVEEIEKADDSDSKKSPIIKKESPKKNSRILLGLQIEDALKERPQLRQSSRIAQLKIKEQVGIKINQAFNDNNEKVGKKKSSEDKTEKRKKYKENDDSDIEEVKVVRKKKKRKEKPLSQLFNEKRPWQSSSEDTEATDVEEDYEMDEEEDLVLGPLKSDHEFSPESEQDDDEEWQPLKRARTARKESDPEEVDDLPCQKCNKKDHPEWILLCDKCNNGWHCSCLRPPLLGIPEGDWYCPPCEHIVLLERLQTKLIEYTKKLSKKEIEDRRKERLAYVGISLNNVLPGNNTDSKKKKRRRRSSELKSEISYESDESEGSEESDDSDSEPIYQLRQRRQAKSYKFNEYDDMIKDALGEKVAQKEDTAGNLGRGKDIQTIVKGLEEDEAATEDKKIKEDEEAETVGVNKQKDVKKNDRNSAAHLKKMLRRKHRKLNSLDFDSDDEDISDEDFKGITSDDDEDDDEDFAVSEEETEDSEEYRDSRKRRKNEPTRRITRFRGKRVDDDDFINDDDTDEEAPKAKKKKSLKYESESESELSSYERKSKSKKNKNNKKKKGGGSKKSRSRIKYGGLTSSDEENFAQGRRRTRGKKATYIDTAGTDSEENPISRRNSRRIETDDDDDEDFVANEEEVEEDDKVAEEDEEDEEEEEDETNSEEERKKAKRSLLVPKIYIKKPLGVKKVAEVPAQGSNGNAPIVSEKISSVPVEPVEVKSDVKLNPSVIESTTEKNIIKNIEVVPELKKTVVQKSNIIHEPIVSNVSAFIRNDIENEDLSEPPGIALPSFEEMSSNNSTIQEGNVIKRRGSAIKKSLDAGNNSVKIIPESAIEIASPPQPFSQAQPTPSVITRMLQAKPGDPSYPLGRIRPKNFAALRDEQLTTEVEGEINVSPSSSPVTRIIQPTPQVYLPVAPSSVVTPINFAHPSLSHPGLNHYSTKGPPPSSHPYSHRPLLDPSPSGGGPINLTESAAITTSVVTPRYPAPVSVLVRPPVHLIPQQYRRPPLNASPTVTPPFGPPSSNVAPHIVSTRSIPLYSEGATAASVPQPPEGYYPAYAPRPTAENPILPGPYEGLPPDTGGGPLYQEPYHNLNETAPAAVNPPPEGRNNHQEEEGEFAGLASYFSSQREDDLDS